MDAITRIGRIPFLSPMRRAFWGTLIGGLLGGVLGFVAGLVIGWGVVPDSSGLEALTGVFWVAGVTAWLGAVLGAFIALRVLRIDRRRSIVGWLAVLIPPLVGGAAWLGVSGTDADDFAPNLFPYLIFVAGVLASAFAACLFGQGSRPDGSTTTSS